jgi:hypothetical protein
MNHNALYDCFAKLGRAKAHLKHLKSLLHPDSAHGYGMLFSVDYERQQIVVRVDPQRRAWVTHWAILTGEIIHQLRSALDHAIRHLVIANGHEPKDRETGFPVCKDEAKFDAEHARKQIRGVGGSAVKIIKELQPFGPGYDKHPLRVLDELWDRDKHRSLNFGTVSLLAVQLVAMHPGRFTTQIVPLSDPDGRDGTELVRQDLDNPLERDIRIVLELLANFTFIDAGNASGRAFPEYLDELVQFAENALIKLGATIGEPSHPCTTNLAPAQEAT